MTLDIDVFVLKTVQKQWRNYQKYTFFKPIDNISIVTRASKSYIEQLKYRSISRNYIDINLLRLKKLNVIIFTAGFPQT